VALGRGTGGFAAARVAGVDVAEEDGVADFEGESDEEAVAELTGVGSTVGSLEAAGEVGEEAKAWAGSPDRAGRTTGSTSGAADCRTK
jgi:hypothetical protein